MPIDVVDANTSWVKNTTTIPDFRYQGGRKYLLHRKANFTNDKNGRVVALVRAPFKIREAFKYTLLPTQYTYINLPFTNK